MTYKVYKVKSGEELKVKVGEDEVVFINKVKLVDEKVGEGKPGEKKIFVKVVVDDEGTEAPIATLNPPKFKVQKVDVAIDKSFRISHTGSNVTVHVAVFVADQLYRDGPFLSDTE